MLSLTKKTDYALLALAHLAQKREVGEGASAREVAEEFRIPQPVLMNVLKDLAKAKLVVSARGAAGGYTLAVDPASISLLEIVTAIEGPMRLARCVNDLPVLGQTCPTACKCPVEGAIRRLHDRVNSFFEQTTLADLLLPETQLVALGKE